MEAWPGSGSSVWCLLDKQAPGSGGVVDAYGAGEVPVWFLILFFVQTNKQTIHTRTHSDTRTHTHTHPRPRTHMSQGGTGLLAQKSRF